MISIDEASKIIERKTFVFADESVDLEKSVGRVLAEDLFAETKFAGGFLLRRMFFESLKVNQSFINFLTYYFVVIKYRLQKTVYHFAKFCAKTVK